MSDLAAWPALAALGSAATWALGSHLFRRALERGGDSAALTPAAANLFKNVLAFAVFVAAWLVLEDRLPARESWAGLAASGFFGFAVGDTLFFAALPRCGVQVAAMVGLVHVPAAAMLGHFVHGERLSAGAWIGGAAVLAGVALVLGERPRERRRSARDVRAGAALAALSALALAVSVVVGHGALQGESVLGGTLVRMTSGIGGALVLAFLAGLTPAARGQPTRIRAESSALLAPFVDRSARRGLLLAALFGSVLGLPLFHYGLRGLPSGTAALLFATTPLFTLPLGAALGENHGPRAVVGACLGFAGVAGVVVIAS